MPRKELVGSALIVMLGLSGASGCGSSHKGSARVSPEVLAAGGQLKARVDPAPLDYAPDTTSGSAGVITPAIFDQGGGSGPAAKVGFVAGFKQNYVSTSSQEGLVITLMEFSSDRAASSYLKNIAPKTLSAAAATDTPFTGLPDAISVDGTKPYSGAYAHAVIAAKGPYFMLLVYLNGAGPGPAPFEFYNWAKEQYARL